MRRRGLSFGGAEEAEGSSGLRDGRLGEERGSSRPSRRPLHGNHASQGRAKRFARHTLQQADAAGERRAPSGHLARAARAAFARPRGGRVEVLQREGGVPCPPSPPLPPNSRACCPKRPKGSVGITSPLAAAAAIIGPSAMSGTRRDARSTSGCAARARAKARPASGATPPRASTAISSISSA